MKNKKSVLIIIFSLLLTLACPIRADASYADDYEYVYAYTVWNYIIIDNYYFVGDEDDDLLDYYMDNFYSPYLDIRKVAYLHDSSSLAVVLSLDGFTLEPYDTVSSSEKLFLDWLYDNSRSIPSLYTHFSMSEIPPIFTPTPVPSSAPQYTPVPTYNPIPTLRPTNTPVPLPEDLPPASQFYFYGLSDYTVSVATSLPSSCAWYVPFSISLVKGASTTISLPDGVSIISSRSYAFLNVYINSSPILTVGINRLAYSPYYPISGSLTLSVQDGGGSLETHYLSWSGTLPSPSPRPTYTPVPLPPESTPIPTFNPNVPINPDYDYNLGQSVEFGQLPNLFSNVSDLSYLFVVPFEFLVTNMWERWYILFLFPVVAIISAFIWERRN